MGRHVPFARWHDCLFVAPHIWIGGPFPYQMLVSSRTSEIHTGAQSHTHTHTHFTHTYTHTHTERHNHVGWFGFRIRGNQHPVLYLEEKSWSQRTRSRRKNRDFRKAVLESQNRYLGSTLDECTGMKVSHIAWTPDPEIPASQMLAEQV